MKKLILIVTLLLSTTAHAHNKEEFRKVMSSWFGADINQLIDSWGVPTREYRMPNGKRLFTWTSSSQSAVFFDGSMGIGIEYSCEKTFTVLKNGTIVEWRAVGNSCYR